MWKGLKRLLSGIRRRWNAPLRFPRPVRPEYPSPMPPPWVAFPDLDSGSTGWRMGSGEIYLMDLHRRYMQRDDRAARHVRDHWPAPEGWTDFYRTYEKRRRKKENMRRRR